VLPDEERSGINGKFVLVPWLWGAHFVSVYRIFKVCEHVEDFLETEKKKKLRRRNINHEGSNFRH
jgi:hypothetical protein